MTNKLHGSDMHYQTHVFCCINERAPDHPRSCCSARGSADLRDYMKVRAKELGIDSIRVNNAGCLERCELGPTLVIYPEGIWYHYETREDIDEILERHIISGERVERLFLPAGQKFFDTRLAESLELKVRVVTRAVPEIAVIELVSPNNDELPAFDAGAHIDVYADGSMRRSYSIANDPKERDRYVIGILRERESRGGSAWLYENMSNGDTLRVTSPINNFSLCEDAAEHVLIAGGIGITPILAMGYRLSDLGAKFMLHYCTKSPEQTAFLEEVTRTFGNNVTFHHDDGDPSKGIDLERILADPTDGAHLYLCGPGGLMKSALASAREWPEENIHYEWFSAIQSDEDWLDEEFEVSLARRKKILTIPVDKSILDVISEAGVFADSSCEDGLCGTCRTTLLNGTAEHRDVVLTKREKDENKAIMICVSRAKKGERLVLDL